MFGVFSYNKIKSLDIPIFPVATRVKAIGWHFLFSVAHLSALLFGLGKSQVEGGGDGSFWGINKAKLAASLPFTALWGKGITPLLLKGVFWWSKMKILKLLAWVFLHLYLMFSVLIFVFPVSRSLPCLQTSRKFSCLIAVSLCLILFVGSPYYCC